MRHSQLRAASATLASSRRVEKARKLTVINTPLTSDANASVDDNYERGARERGRERSVYTRENKRDARELSASRAYTIKRAIRSWKCRLLSPYVAARARDARVLLRRC